MTFETAQYIINKEVQKFHDAHREGQLKFDFFGGEPLLRFSLIQQDCIILIYIKIICSNNFFYHDKWNIIR